MVTTTVNLASPPAISCDFRFKMVSVSFDAVFSFRSAVSLQILRYLHKTRCTKVYFRFSEGENFNLAAPAVGFRRLRSSITVFVNFSRWGDFPIGGRAKIFWRNFPPKEGETLHEGYILFSSLQQV